MNVETKRRPDTAESARAVLREDSILPNDEINTARVRPDPSVEGVWEVATEGWRAIVYLGGYRDPWGRERARDDWETDYGEEEAADG